MSPPYPYLSLSYADNFTVATLSLFNLSTRKNARNFHCSLSIIRRINKNILRFPKNISQAFVPDGPEENGNTLPREKMQIAAVCPLDMQLYLAYQFNPTPTQGYFEASLAGAVGNK